MKKLYPEAEDVPQGVANRAVRIIEKHLRQAQVDRARDLPEEARVRLFRDLRAFFDSELKPGNGETSGQDREGLWARFLRRLEDFLSFSDWNPNTYMPLSVCGQGSQCAGLAQVPIRITRQTSAT
jgi:hypothetical protein